MYPEVAEPYMMSMCLALRYDLVRLQTSKIQKKRPATMTFVCLTAMIKQKLFVTFIKQQGLDCHIVVVQIATRCQVSLTGATREAGHTEGPSIYFIFNI